MNKAWSGKFTSASVSASVDLSKFFASMGSGFATYSIPEGNTVSWSLHGTTVTVQKDGQVAYGGQQKTTLNYNQHLYLTGMIPVKRIDSILSTDVTVETNATLSLNVGGSGREQTITIATSGSNVNVTGHLSGGGPSSSDDFQAQVNQEIRNQIPNQIAREISFNFEAISLFALKNLLFPSNNYIDFSFSALPGDLLVVGNFTKD
jgi:hypothetical protein